MNLLMISLWHNIFNTEGALWICSSECCGECLCVCLQARLSWCWQQAPVYLCPLSKATATATRHLQVTPSQHLSQASATACRDPPLHQAGATNPSSLSFTRLVSLSIVLSLCPLQGNRWYCRPIYFFIPHLFFKLSWRTQFFLLSKKYNFIKFDFLTFRIIYNNFAFVYFIWMGSGSCTMEGMWEELVPSQFKIRSVVKHLICTL